MDEGLRFRGWRRRAVLWHVCAPLTPQRRIHPDNKRRDVCATQALAGELSHAGRRSE
jgi:hypothetical protein